MKVFEGEESYLVGPQHYGKSLKQLYHELGPKQRIILSWDASLDRRFWPRLNQRWEGRSLSDVSSLRGFISDLMSRDLPRDMLWSI